MKHRWKKACWFAMAWPMHAILPNVIMCDGWYWSTWLVVMFTFFHAINIGIWCETDLLCLAVLLFLIFPVILFSHIDVCISGPPASSGTHSSNQNTESQDKNIEWLQVCCCPNLHLQHHLGCSGSADLCPWFQPKSDCCCVQWRDSLCDHSIPSPPLCPKG